MKAIRTAFAAALAALALSPAQANLVDFESLPQGNAANPLALGGATFTTAGGFNYISGFGGNNALCASISSANPANCSLSLDVAFGQQASNISFDFFANNNETVGADIGDVAIFGGVLGNVLLGTVDIIVLDNDSLTLDLVSLTGFQNVTRLVITSTDFGGILYDDFSFQLAVPEPASWAMMIAGFALAGAAVRRRAARPATA